MTLENKQPRISLDPAGVPEELRMLPRWICWRYEVRDGKETKVPISPKAGKLMDATQLANGHPFAEALQALEKDSSLAGIGFLLGEGITGIDLDDCIDEHGTLSAPAQGIVYEFASYTEYSPSGTGVKIFIRGNKSEGVTKCASTALPGMSKIEVYDKKRFFAVTGHRVENTPATVNDSQAALVCLCTRLWPEKEVAKATHDSARPSSAQGFQGSDDELIQRAIAGKKGEAFRSLWSGDTTRYDGDDSRADLALCGVLAFWTANDKQRVDRLFRMSGLMRPKWDSQRGDRTYGQRTIEVAVESCREVYSPQGHEATRGHDNTDQRPQILIDTNEHRVIEAAVVALGNDPEVFQRAGALVRVIGEPIADSAIERQRGALTIAQIDLPHLRERLSRQARFVRSRNGNVVPAHLVPWLVQCVAGRRQWENLPVLGSISTTPVLRSDGTLWQTPGYDPSTHVLYAPSEAFPAIPDNLTLHDARVSVQALSDTVVDFKFQSDAQRSAWLAMVITGIVRSAFDGPTPLFLIDANVRGAGKTLLAQIAGRIVLGQDMPVSSYSHDAEELRKRITSVALAGDTMVLLDNLEGRFGNAALDRALTSTRWRDRVLGSNEQTNLPLKTLWCATGNNVMVGADTARRVIHIRLDVLEQRPEERSGFRHPNILEYVRKHRAELVAAGLTIVRAYFLAGKPQASITPFGGFEGWTDCVRQALVWAGLPDPCVTREGLALSSDSTEAALGQLMDAWRQCHTDEGVVVAAMLNRLYPLDGHGPDDAASEAMRAALENLMSGRPGKALTAKAIGNCMRGFRRRVVDGYLFDFDEREKQRAGVVWRLKRVGECMSASLACQFPPLYTGEQKK